MKRLTALAICIAMACLPAAARAWTERDAGTEGLQGTLTLPDGTQPVPGVLILAGSGPVNRDGNLPGATNDSLKLLAHGLAEQGVASLRIDKRGIGGSRAAGPREDELKFGGYVDDAVAWLGILRAEKRISRLVLLGHSEGGLVATLAAQRADVSQLILVAGASEPAPRIIERQLSAAGVSASLQEELKRIAASLSNGKPVSDVPDELAALYRPSVQTYLASWFPLDPSKELAKIKAPVLIVQGTNDLQIGVDDAKRLLAARPGSKLVLVDGMNHVLKTAPLEQIANLQTYAIPDMPLAPALLPAILSFIGKP